MYKNYAKIKSQISAVNPHKMGILKKNFKNYRKLWGKNHLIFFVYYTFCSKMLIVVEISIVVANLTAL